MERRVEKLEKEVLQLNKKHSDLLKLTIEIQKKTVMYLTGLRERLDDNIFLNEESLRVLVDTYKLVDDLEDPLQNKENIKDEI